MDEYLKIFKALGDKTRFRIVMMLAVKPMCVCEIREIIGSAFSTISNHLKILKEAGIVYFTKDERYVNFALAKDNKIVDDILKILLTISDKEIKADIKQAKIVSRYDKTVC